jgi:filamentous hemagglutinin
MTGGLAVAAYGSEILAGASEAFAAYKAAQAGYSLTAAAATGAAMSGGSYTLGAVVSAISDAPTAGQSFSGGFDQKFSLAGLAAASTVGAYNSIFGTSMLSWAGIPNSLSNILTISGAVIRLNNIVLGQVVGRAAQGAVNQSK